MKKIPLSIALLSLLGNSVTASELAIPHTFTAGTPAVAAEVNENFSAIHAAVNDNHTKIAAVISQLEAMAESLAALEASNSALNQALANMQNENNLLSARVLQLEQDSLPGLSAVMQLGQDSQFRPTVFFSGVNVHINNGTENTEAVNGLGNLIIGYDALRAEDDSDGTANCANYFFLNQTTCENNGWLWGYNHKNGSHNLVIGDKHNYSSIGGLIAGYNNTVNAKFASVTAGHTNTAGADFSSVSGGVFNRARGAYSSITGGTLNQALGESASISGGAGGDAPGMNNWRAGNLFEAE